MNQELLALFEEDQADRRVEQLLAQGAVSDPDDLFCAAMVFQHGSLKAIRPDVTVMRKPRSLMAGGLPQQYGTQYRSVGGRRVLYQVDPATSDEQRAHWDVPPLAEARRRAEELTCDDRPRPRRRGGRQGGGP